MNEMIKTDHVYYEYRSRSEELAAVKAVNDVSMTINQGEFVVVLGRNGSGKSTLARLMNALLIPNQGTVIIDGLSTHEGEHVWEIRKTLGLVLQNPDNQIVATTVEEDVAFGPENLGVEPSEIRTRVDDSIKLVGMEAYAHHSPHMLSGGQKQRIAIAGILAMSPKCIVLDEATSMLDPSGRKEVLEVLHTLNREKAITIILITHHMDEAVSAHQVMIMQEGRLTLRGTPRQIFKNVEAVREAGLDVPQVTALAYDLKKQGLAIDELPVSMDEMVNVTKGFLQNASVKKRNDGTQNHANPALPNVEKATSDQAKYENIITVKDLNHIYMEGTTYQQHALKHINLSVRRGEILGIIGHTGSGKSTLVQHFNGILKPSSGTLEIDGLEASGKALKELRKKVGLIFQYPEHQLFEETVYKDITFGLLKMGLSAEEIKKRVFHVIDLLGISPELLEKSPFELSGGQKRRVAIAGVLAMEPGVLVLDEPTAGLDPKGSTEVFKILSKLNQDEGTTIIIISHNMEDIAAFCHRVAVMHKGELALCGTPREIFSRSNELKSYGLAVPKITELFEQLVTDGFDIPTPVLTVKDAAKLIMDTVAKPLGGDSL